MLQKAAGLTITDVRQSILVKQATILDHREYTNIPALGLIHRLTTSDPTRDADQRLALVMVVRFGQAETIVIDADWLEFALEVSKTQPEALAGLEVPRSAILGMVSSWPTTWASAAGDEADVELRDGIPLWSLRAA